MVKNYIFVVFSVLLITSCVKNSTKQTELPLQKTKTIESQITSEVPIALKDCPFNSDDVYFKDFDKGSWDISLIYKDTYKFGPILGYIIKNNREASTLIIFYNPATNKKIKMLAKETKIDAFTSRYDYYSPACAAST